MHVPRRHRPVAMPTPSCDLFSLPASSNPKPKKRAFGEVLFVENDKHLARYITASEVRGACPGSEDPCAIHPHHTDQGKLCCQTSCFYFRTGWAIRRRTRSRTGPLAATRRPPLRALQVCVRIRCYVQIAQLIALRNVTCMYGGTHVSRSLGPWSESVFISLAHVSTSPVFSFSYSCRHAIVSLSSIFRQPNSFRRQLHRLKRRRDASDGTRSQVAGCEAEAVLGAPQVVAVSVWVRGRIERCGGVVRHCRG